MNKGSKKSLKDVLPKKEVGYGGVKINSKSNKQIDMVDDSNTSSLDKNINYYKPPKKLRRSSLYLIWVCLFLVVIIGGYQVSAIFATVTVQVTPKQLVIPIEGSFSANRAPAEGIEFSVIKLEEVLTQQVPSTGVSKVETKASGVVTITNNYSSAPQTLVVNTRLETPEGLVFKLDKTIIVPGNGSISVNVNASEVGSKYNVGNTSFKIMGFKGTARYDKFLAKTKTPISGGKEGLMSVVKEEDRTKAVTSMQVDLKAKVKNKAQLQIPKDFIIFDDGMMFSFSDEINNDPSGSTATISAKVTMVALLFNTDNLSKYFAEKQLAGEAVPGIKISNIKTLDFKLDNKDQFDFDKTNKVNFTLTGDANLVWFVDTVDLKAKLLNTSVKNQSTVFANYPAIYRAEAILRPPWILSFPNNPSRINFKLIIQ